MYRMHVRRLPCYVVLECSSDPCPRPLLPDPVTVSTGRELAMGCASHTRLCFTQPPGFGVTSMEKQCLVCLCFSRCTLICEPLSG